MTIKNVTINTILAMALLISHSHTWNMEKPSSPDQNSSLAIIPYTEFNLIKLINQKKYNEEYNINHSLLVALAPEMLEKVLSQINTLDNGLKTALVLRVTCKNFYDLPLEHFGKAFQHHNQEEKNKKLEKHMSSEHMILNYWNGRSKALILKLSGAQYTPYSNPLINEIISHNDTEALTCLLEKKIIDPNQKCAGLPALFSAKQINIIEILKKNGCNLHAKGPLTPNALLYHVAFHSPNPKLVAYYLKNLVSAEKTDKINGYSVLHFLAQPDSYIISITINDYLETVSLILNAAPHLVNRLDNYNRTPIDMAKKHCADMVQKCFHLPKPVIKEYLNKLISLFKQYGGQTAKQLEQNKKKDQELINKIKAFSSNYCSKE